MNHTFQTLEFNRIIELWEDYAFTNAAKEKIKNITPRLVESEVRKEQKDTTQARKMIDQIGIPPIVSFKDMEQILTIAEKGGCLMPEQLEYTANILTAVKRLKEYLEHSKVLQLSLAYYEVELDERSELKKTLHDKIRANKVDDYASHYLKDVRHDIEKLNSKIKEKAEIALNKNKKYLTEQFVTTRNGRLCIPVKKEYKNMIAGSVIDKSATGTTLFIEPEKVRTLSDDLYLLKLEEENEVRRILFELSGMIADQKDIFLNNQRIIEKLDFIFAKGKLSAEMNANEPEINVENILHIKNGRHPLMDKNQCVPLNMLLTKENSGMIITGPNTGGKTVAIKTAGLFSLMCQCGLHIPMEEGTIPMYNQVLCDIGDGQDLTESLSTFSAHIKNVLRILKTANHESLVIMDELGSGTDPTEGMGIAIAVLEELKRCGCKFLVTTHYPEVKSFAEKEENIINARMAFDRNSLKPLYQLEMGISGESCAFYIAKRLGMSKEMIECANMAAYGTTDITYMGDFHNKKLMEERKFAPTIKKTITKEKKEKKERQYQIGDSVMVYPDKKIGIVCEKADDKGILRIQLKGKKIYINQKRVKLHVKSEELYPEDYDFSIIFDTVENRKIRHKMEKKHLDEIIVEE